MYVSVTEIQSFKRCRRQWEYGSFNRMGITPIIQPKPYLDLGSMVHKCLAYWMQNPTLSTADGRTQTLSRVFMSIAYQHRKGVVDKYQRATGTTPTSEEMAPLDDAIVLGAAMMGNYQQHYQQPLPEHLRFCSPEQEMLIAIPGTEHMCTVCQETVSGMPAFYTNCNECHGSGIVRHYLKARLDALAQDTSGNLYVVENKTYDKRPDVYLLEVNDQFIGYVWAAQQFAKQLPDSPPVVGIAYNGLWKRATPPQRPKKLEIADLFVRTIITPSQDEVNEYGEELARTVLEMAADPYIYKNRVWQGCWDCSFEHLCRTQSQGGDVDFVLRTQFTTRTEDDATDIVTAVDANPLLA
jgi:hypothetical protein